MILPNYLLNKIDLELNKYPLKEIRVAYEELSNSYRKNRDQIHTSLDSPQKRLAYVAARMPATYSAVWDVLQQLNEQDECKSLLDVGAGCGTASFAAADVLNSLNKITALEQNSEMLKIGKSLASGHPVLKDADWHSVDIISNQLQFPTSDLVILSYSLNEIHANAQQDLLLKLWNVTNKFLVIIEPGTTASFNLIHSVRNLFINKEFSILAPCPHANICPAYASEDLCHFSSRVQRTSFHRYLKQGERNFEDEKYSYLILTKLTKTLKENYEARVVRKPTLRPGLISLKLCTTDGFFLKSITKKDKELYKEFKEKSWGDKLLKIEPK